jgi:hypothetical protein
MIKIIEVDSFSGKETHIFITNEDGTTLSMLKSTYDEQQAQAEHFTPNV